MHVRNRPASCFRLLFCSSRFASASLCAYFGGCKSRLRPLHWPCRKSLRRRRNAWWLVVGGGCMEHSLHRSEKSRPSILRRWRCSVTEGGGVIGEVIHALWQELVGVVSYLPFLLLFLCHSAASRLLASRIGLLRLITSLLYPVHEAFVPCRFDFCTLLASSHPFISSLVPILLHVEAAFAHGRLRST